MSTLTAEGFLIGLKSKGIGYFLGDSQQVFYFHNSMVVIRHIICIKTLHRDIKHQPWQITHIIHTLQQGCHATNYKNIQQFWKLSAFFA